MGQFVSIRLESIRTLVVRHPSYAKALTIYSHQKTAPPEVILARTLVHTKCKSGFGKIEFIFKNYLQSPTTSPGILLRI